MEAQEIIDAITKNPGLVNEVVPKLKDNEHLSKIINNRANAIYEDKIGEETKKIHSKYDEDMLEILGEKPGTREDGGKEKTYEKSKSLFLELKKLREQKDLLEKDEAVKKLKAENEKLKEEGGGEFYKNQYETAVANFEKKEADLLSKIEEAEKANENFIKLSDLDKGLQGLKLNEDISENVVNLTLDSAKQKILQNAKIKDGKVYYYDDNGKMLLNGKGEPMKANEVIAENELVKSVTLKDRSGGGGADPDFQGGKTGNIKTTKVEGKGDVKSLSLDANSFKTKSEFAEVADKILAENGITKESDSYFELKDNAYKEYEVSKLPEN